MELSFCISKVTLEVNKLLSYILPFLLIISVIVFIHELGHYLFAKMFGVKVEEFSIGFGKELFGFNDRSGTRWKFSVIPAGGYVRMFGDLDETSSKDVEKIESMSDEDRSRTLHFKPLYQKALIIFGGPLANFLLAYVLMTGLHCYPGKVSITPVLVDVVQGSPAFKAGLKAGDRVLEINNIKIERGDQLMLLLSIAGEKPIELHIMRGQNYSDVVVIPEIKKVQDPLGVEKELPVIGIKLSTERVPQGFFPSAGDAAVEIYNLCGAILDMTVKIIQGKVSTDALGGPVKVAMYSGHSYNAGIIALVTFVAVLSVNLGLFNLFPIPPLDGGFLLFYVLEVVVGAKIAAFLKEWVAKLGIIALIFLIIFVTLKDIRFILS